MNADSIRSEWQASSPEPVRGRFRLRRWWVRFEALVNLAGLTALGLALLATALVSETLLCRLGCALSGIGFLYTAYRHARIATLPNRSQACLEYYRQNLERMRDHHATHFRWGLLPPSTGIAIALLGWWISEPAQWVSVVGVAAFWSGMLLAAYVDQRSRKGALEVEIAQLSA